jgi:hypothetical protein
MVRKAAGGVAALPAADTLGVVHVVHVKEPHRGKVSRRRQSPASLLASRMK